MRPRIQSAVDASLCRRTRYALICLGVGMWMPAAAGIKVDLSRSGRSDTAAPYFVEWQFDPSRPSSNFGPLQVTLRKVGESGLLEGGLYKSGIDSGARVACDGLQTRGAALELCLAGLTAGVHSVTTYHNWLQASGQPPGKFHLYVNGKLALTNLQPSVQVTNDYDMASAWVTVPVEPARDVVLRFVPADPADSGAIVLNGFEVDHPDPARKAIKPVPMNDDEHVAAERGSVRLAWIAPPTALSHDVYFGTDRLAVAAADRRSPLFVGNQKETAYTVSSLNHWATYYWRIDEVDRSGQVTRGELWRFRTRHLAFPSAEGYGRFARGGRGGRVLEVTNLADAGPGSLRAAIEAEGPRTVVFLVSGLITLESRLVIRNPYLTIAGQTAPGKGICLRKYNLGLAGTHDVSVRYLRVRPGDISGQTLDGMGMAGSDHCIIDHCSISWSLDEAFSSRSAKNITLQRTLISEALNVAGHKKYPPGTQHGYAASIGGLIGSFHHNLLAHCAGRNWSLAGGLNQGGRHTGWLDIRNNVVYNWKHRTTDGGAAKVNFVNNYYKPGPASTQLKILNPERNNIQGFGPQNYFISGNVMAGHYGPEDALAGVTRPEPYENFVVAAPFFEAHVRTHSAAESWENVLADVGCNRPGLDAHDQRIIQEVREGTARYRGGKSGLPGIPDSQQDVGGWEHYPEVRHPPDYDTDHDGMADLWERGMALDPRDPADANGDRDGDGYSNLEEFLGSLNGEFPARQQSL